MEKGKAMSSIETTRLQSGAAQLGLLLSPEQLERFDRYAELLNLWNERINLTRIPADKVVELQFLDSLLLHSAYPLTAVRSVIDVGTGAGFPGIPIAIAFPDTEVTLIDSTGKKIEFIRLAANELGLKNVTLHHIRAEDGARNPELRESFDLATARAVASLDLLLEWLLPFVKVGGAAVALKGDNIDSEIPDGREAARDLGGELALPKTHLIPHTEILRTFAVVRKVAPTPSRYPRPATQAKRKR